MVDIVQLTTNALDDGRGIDSTRILGRAFRSEVSFGVFELISLNRLSDDLVMLKKSSIRIWVFGIYSSNGAFVCGRMRKNGSVVSFTR